VNPKSTSEHPAALAINRAPSKRRGINESDFHSIKTALAKLDEWIEAEGFCGWDPHDALNSPLLRWARKRRLLGIAAVQLLRRSPVNLRPLVGIRKGFNPKAMGLFVATYAQRFMATKLHEHLERTHYFFTWLVEHASPGYAGPCWGYNFDWPNRDFLAPAGTPTVVNTAFIGLSILSAETTLGTLGVGFGSNGDEQRPTATGLEIARGACEFVLRNLQIFPSAEDEQCFSYTPLDRRFIHNANVLGAWLLAAVYAHTQEEHLAKTAMRAARFTARRQLSDGSWSYGITPRNSWVDNFHTGYVLVGLRRVAAYLHTGELDSAIQTGYQFWKTRLFESNCIPKYYPDRVYPVDIHSVAQAILTFLEFSDVDPDAMERAWEVALWAIRNMQDEKGFFHYQLRQSYRIRIPYMRWSQAWMQRALTALCVPGLADREGEVNANLG
jgi:hypothetical protein